MPVLVRPIKEIGVVDKFKDHICIRLSGLIGDTIHAATRFQYINKQCPDLPWVVIHSYPQPKFQERITAMASELLKPHFESGKIVHYFCSGSGKGGAPYINIPEVVDAVRFCRIPPDHVFDCLYKANKRPDMTWPDLGIDRAVQKDPKKAVIFRYSGWHNHFPQRNRPHSEWKQIEEYLLENGYDVYLVGLDDPMVVSSKVQDLRRTFKLRGLLEFSKDASICISVATFFYQWMQHICPTAVLSDDKDCASLNGPWKLNNNLNVIGVGNGETYLNNVFKFIDSVGNLT